jgi:hypothetical protein
MKLNQLAIVAANIADANGWGAVTAARIASVIEMHPVSVARTARAADVATAARHLVDEDPDRWPRAYVEAQLDTLTTPQLLRLSITLKEIIG